jgi:hypothetical protein
MIVLVMLGSLLLSFLFLLALLVSQPVPTLATLALLMVVTRLTRPRRSSQSG